MKTKIISFSLFVFLITSPTKAQEWEFVGLDSLVILNMYFAGDTIYAGTYSLNNNLNSGLYFSSDHGNNWTKIDSSLGGGSIWGLEKNIDNTIYIIKCPCQAPLASPLYKTTNNGQSWEVVNNISVNPIQWFGISPFNPNEIYAIDVLGFGGGTYFNTLYKSINNGNSWESIGSFPGSSHGSEIIFSFDLTDSTNLYVVVDDRFGSLYLFKSTDEGNNWFYVSAPPIRPNDIYTDKIASDRIYLLGGPYISNNSGLSWFFADSGLTDTSYYLSFYQDHLTTNLLYILKSDGLFYSSEDTFYWKKIEGSENLSLFAGFSGFSYYLHNLKNIYINDIERKIYLGTAMGIFRTDIVTTVLNEGKLFPNDLSLEQNYPNPFNPSTNIRFTITDFGFVSLKVYDMLGRVVATLVNEDRLAGEYEIKFDATGLTSGIYFYQLKAGSFTETRKMILLR